MRQVSGLGGGKVKSYGRNWGTKAIAVLLAFVLWLFVFGQQRPTNVPEFTRTLTNIPVEIIGADRDFQYLITPATVDIVIRGSQEFINSMVGRDHRASVDVRGLQEGIHNLEVTTSIAGGFTQAIRPNFVTVIIDPIVTRDFTISVETQGELPEGVRIEEINLSPSQVQLTGPRGELERVTSVRVTLNLTEITESKEISAPISIMDIHNRTVNALQGSVSNVIMEVVVAQRYIEQQLSVNYINLEEGLTARLTQSAVKAIIPININVNSIEPYVDLRGLGEGRHVVQIQWGGEGISFEPKEIVVIIERE